MSLINCPECGSSISDKAEKCPNCAVPLINNINNNIKLAREKNDIMYFSGCLITLVVAALIAIFFYILS